LLFGAGVFIPYIIVVLIILFTGQFHTFWLWTILYASKYEAGDSTANIMLAFKNSFLPIWDEFYYLLILALAGILVLFLTSYSLLQKLFALFFFIASACLVSAGFYFRPHYFIALLPGIALMIGIGVEFIAKQIRRIHILKSPITGLIILLLVILFTVYINYNYYFNSIPTTVCSMAYWGNPFNYTQEIAKYISDNTNDTDKIVVMGSEPEIYFYANRAAGTSYLYTYPLVENQPYNEEMQQEMINEIEKSKPAFIVGCGFYYSWLTRPGTPITIFKWCDEYIAEHYILVGEADFYNNMGWKTYWNDDLKNRTGPSTSNIVILKRKPVWKIK
jgi:hypothetical protein